LVGAANAVTRFSGWLEMAMYCLSIPSVKAGKVSVTHRHEYTILLSVDAMDIS
jgi:hypothetical protein